MVHTLCKGDAARPPDRSRLSERRETLFVNVGESKGTIREFMDKQAFDFPVIIDVTGNISGMYRITGLPATMVIGKDGEFRHILLGELTEDTPLQQWLKDSI